MTYAELKKVLKEKKSRGYSFAKIGLSYGTYDTAEGEYDLNIHLFMVDRWGNKDFDCVSYTDTDEKKIIAKGKRITTTLQNNGYKAEWHGWER